MSVFFNETEPPTADQAKKELHDTDQAIGFYLGFSRLDQFRWFLLSCPVLLAVVRLERLTVYSHSLYRRISVLGTIRDIVDSKREIEQITVPNFRNCGTYTEQFDDGYKLYAFEVIGLEVIMERFCRELPVDKSRQQEEAQDVFCKTFGLTSFPRVDVENIAMPDFGPFGEDEDCYDSWNRSYYVIERLLAHLSHRRSGYFLDLIDPEFFANRETLHRESSEPIGLLSLERHMLNDAPDMLPKDFGPATLCSADQTSVESPRFAHISLTPPSATSPSIAPLTAPALFVPPFFDPPAPVTALSFPPLSIEILSTVPLLAAPPLLRPLYRAPIIWETEWDTAEVKALFASTELVDNSHRILSAPAWFNVNDDAATSSLTRFKEVISDQFKLKIFAGPGLVLEIARLGLFYTERDAAAGVEKIVRLNCLSDRRDRWKRVAQVMRTVDPEIRFSCALRDIDGSQENAEANDEANPNPDDA